jgi:hypothetical protein
MDPHPPGSSVVALIACWLPAAAPCALIQSSPFAPGRPERFSAASGRFLRRELLLHCRTSSPHELRR